MSDEIQTTSGSSPGMDRRSVLKKAAVAERLAASGAEIEFCDPYIPEVNTQRIHFPLVPFSPEAMAAADMVVVLVDHSEFDPALIAEHSRLVFDTKNLMRGQQFAGEVL